jgi:hypothetical protein
MSSVLKDLADGARALQRIKKDLSDVQFQEEILSLRQLLVSAQSEIIESNQEIAGLKSKLKDLQATKEFAEGLHSHNGFKFESKDGEPFGHPFCPTCETNHGRFFRLVPPGGNTGNTYKERGSRICPNCKHVYGYPVPVFPELENRGED